MVDNITEVDKTNETRLSGWRQKAIDERIALIKRVQVSAMAVKGKKDSIKHVVREGEIGKCEFEVSSV